MVCFPFSFFLPLHMFTCLFPKFHVWEKSCGVCHSLTDIFRSCSIHYNDLSKSLLSLTAIIHGDIGSQAECPKCNMILKLWFLILFNLVMGIRGGFAPKYISLHLGNSIPFPFGELLLSYMPFWWDCQSNPLPPKKWACDPIFTDWTLLSKILNLYPQGKNNILKRNVSWLLSSRSPRKPWLLFRFLFQPTFSCLYQNLQNSSSHVVSKLSGTVPVLQRLEIETTLPRCPCT